MSSAESMPCCFKVLLSFCSQEADYFWATVPAHAAVTAVRFFSRWHHLPPTRRDRFARWQICVPADKSERCRQWACREESNLCCEPAVNPPLINELKIKGRAAGGSGTGEEKRCKNDFQTNYMRRWKCFEGCARQLARCFSFSATAAAEEQRVWEALSCPFSHTTLI